MLIKFSLNLCEDSMSVLSGKMKPLISLYHFSGGYSEYNHIISPDSYPTSLRSKWPIENRVGFQLWIAPFFCAFRVPVKSGAGDND